MSISVERWGDSVRIAVVGQLVVSNRHELKQALVEELARGARRVRIDFSETPYIDSSGLGVLVSLYKKIREIGGDLRLTNLSSELRRTFAMTRLDTLFDIEDDDDGGSAPRPAPLQPRAPDPLSGAEEEQRPDEPTT